MPTINQLVRKGRKDKKKKTKAPALQYTFNAIKQRRTRHKGGAPQKTWCMHPSKDDDTEESRIRHCVRLPVYV